MRAIHLITTISLFAGCVEIIDGPGQEELLLNADFVDFVEQVQPILDARCANPLCHGNSERPLEVYSVHQHRINPKHTYLDGELTEEELWRNFERACSFLTEIEDPDDCAILEKPLSEEAGGGEHGGGTQFQDKSTQDYQTIRDWISNHDLEGL